jgi:hypothetical protein
VKFSAGPFFVKSPLLELGFDLNLSELTSPLFWRAVIAEFMVRGDARVRDVCDARTCDDLAAI